MSKSKSRSYSTNIEEIDSIFEDFLDFLEYEKHSDEKTVKAYRTDVFMLIEYLITNYKDIKKNTILLILMT